jgi:hypothetical protein
MFAQRPIGLAFAVARDDHGMAFADAEIDSLLWKNLFDPFVLSFGHGRDASRIRKNPQATLCVDGTRHERFLTGPLGLDGCGHIRQRANECEQSDPYKGMRARPQRSCRASILRTGRADVSRLVDYSNGHENPINN